MYNSDTETTQQPGQLNFGLLLERTNDRLRRVPRDDLRVMQHVKLLSRVAACIEQDGFLSSGVVRHEL